MAPHELGFWGKPTATIDWCESNYEVTHYVAEFWNTISNLSMIIPPAWGAYFAWKDALGLRFVACHISLLRSADLVTLFLYELMIVACSHLVFEANYRVRDVIRAYVVERTLAYVSEATFWCTIIGFGSWAFHMTLLYEMQLFDELPMLWGSCVIIYCLVDILFPKLIRKSNMVVIALTTYAVLVSVVYLAIKKPIFHEVAYAILVALIFVMDIQLARTRKCDIRLLISGWFLYLLGFAVWNIDNVFCSRITSVRAELPSVVGPITQLHAWWHLFAGYSTYMNIMFCSHASAVNNKLKCEITPNLLVGIKLETKRPTSGLKHRLHLYKNGTN